MFMAGRVCFWCEECGLMDRKSSTPTSLIALLYPTFPAPYRSPLARFAFRHVYVDASQRGLYRSKDLCSFSGRDLMNTIMPKSSEGRNGARAMDMELDDAEPAASTSGSSRKVTEKSLDDYGFITGDYLSVSLYVPEPKQSAPTRERDREPVPPLGRDARSGAGADGEWSKGEALPPRGGGRGSFQSRGGRERDGGYRDAPPPGIMGMGIRGGASRRSPSPRRNGYGARSRSPERRGSFYERRRDRSP